MEIHTTHSEEYSSIFFVNDQNEEKIKKIMKEREKSISKRLCVQQQEQQLCISII